jgi:hypothetical protein
MVSITLIGEGFNAKAQRHEDAEEKMTEHKHCLARIIIHTEITGFTEEFFFM